MSVSLANITLWHLHDNDEAEDAADYRVTCDDCATMISETQYGEHDGLCDRCYDAVHFTCDACGGEFHCDDHHETSRLKVTV